MGTYTDLAKLQRPKVQAPDPSKASEAETVRNSVRSEFRTEKRSENRTPHLPVKRNTKRYSFEFYEDQISRLKHLKRDAEDQGENITLSDIAREAFDLYLKSRN
jgi:hypothetical protein